MNDTRITTRLPNLQIEILRRELADEGAEIVNVRLYATPSFAAVGRTLAAELLSPAALLSLSPVGWWMRATAAVWKLPLAGVAAWSAPLRLAAGSAPSDVRPDRDD